MAFTATHLATLEAAAASGTLTVKLEDRQITYQSLDQLLRAIEVARKDVAVASANGMRRGRYLEHGRGY